MDSSAIVPALKAAAKRENIDKRVASGLIRKYTRSNAKPENREDLCRLMLHLEEMAGKHYERTNIEAACLRAESALNKDENYNSRFSQTVIVPGTGATSHDNMEVEDMTEMSSDEMSDAGGEEEKDGEVASDGSDC